MKIQCPSCDQRLEIPEELAGQTIECPACNASLGAPTTKIHPSTTPQTKSTAKLTEKPQEQTFKTKAALTVSSVFISIISFYALLYFSDLLGGEGVGFSYLFHFTIITIGAITGVIISKSYLIQKSD